ncbi:NAD(+) kinase [Motiliproteus sp.]|uniref:NAD(+) kinase n=1 Tax=Motiliproteus sp. TaxID=1898955 RepID=UPI003BAC8EE7
MENFRNIGLVGRQGSTPVIQSLEHLVPFLQGRGLEVFVDDRIADLVPAREMKHSTVKMMGQHCDLVIVVGGDGSLLGAARQLAHSGVPVLGINRGNLGFLTDIAPDEIEQKVGEVLDGHYHSEQRFLIEAEVFRDGEKIGFGEALNDIILHPNQAARMIRFELYIDDQFVYSQRSDGLIVSTPTGSTAYALSGGGPIMHPKLDALVLVPIFPHTLSSRPIVIDGNAELKIVVAERNDTHPFISCDGQHQIPCLPGDEISVRKKPHPLHLIHPLCYNYYESCRSKLGWGSKLGE